MGGKMKKFFLPLLLLFFLLTINFASKPDIIVVPEKCLINNSVYVIFQWRAPDTVDNFNVTVSSDAVEFENTSLCYAAVVEDSKIFHIFKGKAIKSGNHSIDVKMSYWIDGIRVKKKYELDISIIPKIVYVEKIKIIEKIVEENVSMGINSNISNKEQNSNVSVKNTLNINPTINKSFNTLTTSKEINSSMATHHTDSHQNSILSLLLYGVGGLILGVLFGFMVVYIIKM
jgi:hypothetical protein